MENYLLVWPNHRKCKPNVNQVPLSLINFIYIYIYKKLKEQLDKHIKLKDKKKTALHEFSSSYETSSGKIKLQMLLLLYDKELTRDCTKAINIYKRNFYKNGHKIYIKSMLIYNKKIYTKS